MAKNKNSEMLLAKKIRHQLEQLFLAFDSENNGYISSDEISLDNVPAEILIILTPLFVEMENLNESLTKDRFCHSAFNLYMSLGPIDKSTVLSFKLNGESLKDKYRDQNTFVPKINPKSQKIVNQSEYNGVAVLDRLEWAEL